jgi:hypothetical protein
MPVPGRAARSKREITRLRADAAYRFAAGTISVPLPKYAQIRYPRAHAGRQYLSGGMAALLPSYANF